MLRICLTRLFKKLVRSRPSALGVLDVAGAHALLVCVWIAGVRASGAGKYAAADTAGSMALLRGKLPPKVSNGGDWDMPSCEQSNAPFTFPPGVSVFHQKAAEILCWTNIPSHCRTLSGLGVSELCEVVLVVVERLPTAGMMP